MEPEAAKLAKELDRFQVYIRMVATGVQEPTRLAYRKNGIKKGVTQDGVLKIDHFFPKAHPIICCDHAEANDRHKIRFGPQWPFPFSIKLGIASLVNKNILVHVIAL
jgi:hypothetical protein